MKIKHVKAKNPEDGLHFDVTHEDGRTTPVQVSTINLVPIAKKMGYAGNTGRGAAEHVARIQAHANFAAEDQQKVVREANGAVAKPKSARAKKAKTR